MNPVEVPFKSQDMEHTVSEDVFSNSKKEEKQPVSVVDGIQYGMDTRGTIRRKMRKVGRNDVCPCGSGLKFKKCNCN